MKQMNTMLYIYKDGKIDDFERFSQKTVKAILKQYAKLYNGGECYGMAEYFLRHYHTADYIAIYETPDHYHTGAELARYTPAEFFETLCKINDENSPLMKEFATAIYNELRKD